MVHNISIMIDDEDVAMNSQFMLRYVLVQQLQGDVNSDHPEKFALNSVSNKFILDKIYNKSPKKCSFLTTFLVSHRFPTLTLTLNLTLNLTLT